MFVSSVISLTEMFVTEPLKEDEPIYNLSFDEELVTSKILVCSPLPVIVGLA